MFIKQFIILISLTLLSINCAVQKDLVTDLNNMTHYDLPWYSGYLNISDARAKMMAHYFFFPSQDKQNSDKQPLVLWLNGGPGCSSLLGATLEHGPFIFKTNSTELEINEYAWNKKAHMLYVESPPGVGFSTTSDPNFDDAKTAHANLATILKFFELYPEHSHRDFYIAGESYGGIYIPTLSQQIQKHNQNGQGQQINLKGIMIGNGCTDPLECNFQTYVNPFEYAAYLGQGWYNQEQQTKYEKYCGSHIDPEVRKLNSNLCIYQFNKMQKEVSRNMNPYDLIGKCYHQKIPQVQGQMDYHINQNYQNMQQHLEQEALKEVQVDKRRRVLEELELGSPGVIPPCADGLGVTVFFNNPQVQKALHVKVGIEWGFCSSNVQRHYTRSSTGSYHLYPELIKSGLRIWHFSGDTDAVVGTPGTLYWIDKLNKQMDLTEIVPWRAWYTEGAQYGYQAGNRQNAGQFWRTEGITFVTFKGCGHTVPIDNHVATFDLISNFLEGEDLPAY